MGQGSVTHQNPPVTRQWGGLTGTSQERPPSDSRSRAKGSGGRGCRTLSNQQPVWPHLRLISGQRPALDLSKEQCVRLRPQGAPDTRMLTDPQSRQRGLGEGQGKTGAEGRGPHGAGPGTESVQWAWGGGWVLAPRPSKGVCPCARWLKGQALPSEHSSPMSSTAAAMENSTTAAPEMAQSAPGQPRPRGNENGVRSSIWTPTSTAVSFTAAEGGSRPGVHKRMSKMGRTCPSSAVRFSLEEEMLARHGLGGPRGHRDDTVSPSHNTDVARSHLAAAPMKSDS